MEACLFEGEKHLTGCNSSIDDRNGEGRISGPLHDRGPNEVKFANNG